MFDIERFPESEVAKRMLSRVSPIYEKAYVGKWLFEVIGIEMDEVHKIFRELPEQRFVESVTWGVAYLEQKYGIGNDDSLSLEARRSRLKKKRRRRYPLNPFHMEKLIKDFVGLSVEVDETLESGILHIGTEVNADLSNSVSLFTEIKRIKPAHLMVHIDTKVVAETPIYIGGTASTHITYEVLPATVRDLTATTTTLYICGTTNTHTKYETYPKLADRMETKSVLNIGGVENIHIIYTVTEMRML